MYLESNNNDFSSSQGPSRALTSSEKSPQIVGFEDWALGWPIYWKILKVPAGTLAAAAHAVSSLVLRIIFDMQDGDRDRRRLLAHMIWSWCYTCAV